jgi:molybdopterin-guanine dinucleotide biosynthesis protein MobB
MPPLVAFNAPSGTGKTTYLEQLIRVLVARGLSVAAVKHDNHGFQMDRPGKDTHRLRAAGARRVAIVNDRELAVYGDVEPALTVEELAGRYLGPVDLVLVEGFRQSGVPKIIYCRGAAPREAYDATTDEVIAVVGDLRLPGGKPHFSADDPDALADFLVATFELSRRRS